MKQDVSTKTHILLQITLALCVATYIGLTGHWFIPACIFYAGSIVFSFLTVLSSSPKGQRRLKLIIMTYSSVISSAFSVGICSLTCLGKSLGYDPVSALFTCLSSMLPAQVLLLQQKL